jgi:hypothetical protein
MFKIQILLGLLFFCFQSIAQQTGPILLKSTKLTSVKKITTTNNQESITNTEEKTEVENPPILILYGVGNLNQESFSELNSSGKASFLFIPMTTEKRSLRFNISVNKNATNNDSLLASTLVFPEIGNHSFLGTVEHIWKWENSNFQTKNYVSLFAEFAYKKIKVTDTSIKNTGSRNFATVNYTIGSKIIFGFSKNDFSGSLSFIPYLSYFNIPDEDVDDYRVLANRNFKFINNKQLADNFLSFGVRTVFEINSFQIFADFRHIFRNENVSAIELRGLKSNIGVVFNANILKATL